MRFQDSWGWEPNAGWALLASGVAAPPPREAAAAAYHPGLAAGVLTGGLSEGSNADDTWEFTGGSWRQRAPANSPRQVRNATAAYCGRCVQDGGVVVFYGGETSSPSLESAAFAWDGADWAELAPDVGGTAHPGGRRGTGLTWCRGGARR